jgi:hypothetical protein
MRKDLVGVGDGHDKRPSALLEPHPGFDGVRSDPAWYAGLVSQSPPGCTIAPALNYAPIRSAKV